MGYAIIHDPNTLRPLEILGDGNAALKSLGRPHNTPDGRRVDLVELDEADRYDSGDQIDTERSIAPHLPQSN